ncbi:MAG: kelch repeat-containing protein [Planctomycetota bacterium]
MHVRRTRPCTTWRTATLAALAAATAIAPPSLPAQMQWIHTVVAPPGPADLWGAAFFAWPGNVLLGQRAIVFGGLSPTGPRGDTWMLTTAGWQGFTPQTSPSPRWDMAYDPARKTIFGGRTAPTAFTDETWWWAPVDRTWIRLLPTTTASPSARAEAALAGNTQDDVYVFGGRDGTQVFGEFWRGQRDWSAWNRITWTQLPPGPSPRYGAALVLDFAGTDVFLFGGRDVNGQTLADTWHFDGATWRRVTGSAPPSRSHHALVADTPRLTYVLYGGLDTAGVPTNDVWEFDGATWVARTPTGTPPPARAGQRAWFASPESEMQVWGGAGSSADLWSYRPLELAEVGLFGSTCRSLFAPLSLRALDPRFARPGDPWGVAVENLHPSASLSFVWAGTSRTTWLGLALPIDLTPLALPGCFLHASVDLSVPVPVVAGRCELAFTIPANPGLIAADLYWQAYGLGSPLGPALWATTNGLAIHIGTR